MSDTIADMLTRLRNAHQALQPTVVLPYSRMKESIAKILKKEGYIEECSIEGEKTAKHLKLKLKYRGKKGVIEGCRRVSSPGLRRYVGSTDIPRVKNGLGTAIVSTSQGLMTGTEARKNKLGGELLCFVW
jgi:small subunit ribosomal protein S8